MPGKSQYTPEKGRKNTAMVRERRTRIMVNMDKAEGEAVKAAAEAAGQSYNAYIIQAVRERMERAAARQAAGE